VKQARCDEDPVDEEPDRELSSPEQQRNPTLHQVPAAGAKRNVTRHKPWDSGLLSRRADSFAKQCAFVGEPTVSVAVKPASTRVSRVAPEKTED
jgi:hypothetical protein